MRDAAVEASGGFPVAGHCAIPKPFRQRRKFTPLVSERGLPLLAAKARRYGLAALAINNCLHLAALWPEVEALTNQGLGALAMCPSNANVAPAGGIRKLFGTNPLAFGWPTGDDCPYVFDFATSVIARGKIELYRLDNKPLPDGWGIDRDGQPSRDAAVLDGGALLPFGGYKGSAIATMIELLAAVWIGDLLSSESSEADGGRGLVPLHGELIIAIDPTAFGAVDYESHSRALLDAIRNQGARLLSCSIRSVRCASTGATCRASFPSAAAWLPT